MESDTKNLVKWTNLRDKYLVALQRLVEAQMVEKPSSLERDGIIQRFEFTYELAWKTLQAYFQHQGVAGMVGPGPVLEEAGRNGLLPTPELWQPIRKGRNLVSHVYAEEVAVKLAEAIRRDYVDEFARLAEKLSSLKTQA